MDPNLVKILLIAHASLGGIALAAGLIALITKKGRKAHVISGKVFFWSLLISGITALVLSVTPGRENPFLFTIGIFSTYLIIGGYRAVRYKRENLNLIADYIISITMMITGIGMISLPIILSGGINIILTVFGSIGIFLSIQDLVTFRNKEKLKKGWLKAHLGKMTGGYIAAFTAFVVVNQVLPPLIGWLGPTVLGSLVIAYWNIKLRKQKA